MTPNQPGLLIYPKKTAESAAANRYRGGRRQQQQQHHHHQQQQQKQQKQQQKQKQQQQSPKEDDDDDDDVSRGLYSYSDYFAGGGGTKERSCSSSQMEESSMSTFDCIHPSSPSRNLHHIPSSEWSLTSSFLDHSSSSHHEKMLHSSNNSPYQKNHSTTRTKPKRARLPPAYHCRLALLVLDLQNDFLGDESPSFYLAKQMMNGNHYLSRHRSILMQRIRELALQTQQQGGVVFFIQSVYSPTSSYCAMSSPGSAFHPLAKALRHELLMSKPSSSSSSAAAVVSTTNAAATAAANHNTNRNYHNNVHVMVKPWHSAFLETTLHAQLQRLGVHDLIVCGVTTHQSVAATIRSAYHMDYNVYLSVDATAHLDPQLHVATCHDLAPFCYRFLPANVDLSNVFFGTEHNDDDDNENEDNDVDDIYDKECDDDPSFVSCFEASTGDLTISTETSTRSGSRNTSSSPQPQSRHDEPPCGSTRTTTTATALRILSPSQPSQYQSPEISRWKATTTPTKRRPSRSTENKNPDRLVFDGCVRLYGIGAGDAMLIPDILNVTRANVLLQQILNVFSLEQCQKLRLKYSLSQAKKKKQQQQHGANGHNATGVKTNNNNNNNNEDAWTALLNPVMKLLQTHVGHDFDHMFVMALDPHLKTKCIGGELSRLLLEHEDDDELLSSRTKEGDAATEPHSTTTNGVSHHDGETTMTTTHGQPYFTATLILGQGRILDLRPIPSTPLHGSSGGGDGKTTKRVAPPPPPPQHIYCHHNSLLLMGPETMHQYQASFQNRKKTARNVTPQTTKPLPGAKTVTKVMTATTCPPQVAITFRKTRTIATTPPTRPSPPPPQPTTTSTSTSASTSTTPIRSNRVTFSKTTSMTTEPEVCRVEKQIHPALGMASAPACGTTTTTATTAMNAYSSSSKITNITINYVAGDTVMHRRPPLGSGVRHGGGASTFQHCSVAAATAAATSTSNTDTDGSRGKTAAATIHNGSKQKKDDGNDNDGAISEYIPWYHDSELIGMFLLGILLSCWMK